MRRAISVVSAALVVTLLPSSAFAWGFSAHRYIMRRALELLPAELKPFYDKNRDEIAARAVDPDLWRNVGWDDDPNHFINFGVRDYGPPPFSALPREYGSALEKFGIATIRRNGTLPWRLQEEFGNLRRTFEGFKGNALYVTSDLVLFSPVASHYIQDATQPFHVSNNYDGQLTMQQGLHARFERDLFEKFEARLTITPAPPRSIASILDFAFDTMIASYGQVDAILKADKDAIGSRDTYDDAYFERFFTGVRPILEQQLGTAITATASVIMAAWEQAGKPALRLQDVRPVQKVRQP